MEEGALRVVRVLAIVLLALAVLWVVLLIVGTPVHVSGGSGSLPGVSTGIG
jgi:hypothetical protein